MSSTAFLSYAGWAFLPNLVTGWLQSVKASRSPVPTDDPIRHATAESSNVNLKTAQDNLSDPIKRFAYERFGPDMLKWQHCKTMRDYLATGIQTSSLPFYAGSILMMALLSLTNYLQWGRFWRYLTFAGLFLLEPTTATISAPCSSSQGNFHPLHRVLSIGKPLSTSTPTPVAATSQHDLQQLVRLEGTAKASEIESGRLPAMDMAPFAGDENEQSTKELRGRTKEWLINNFIRADPEVKDAMGRVIASRRRSGAPAGARAS